MKANQNSIPPGSHVINEFVQYYYMLPEDIANKSYKGQRYFTVKSPMPAYKTWMPPFPARHIAELSEKIWRVTDTEIVVYYNRSASLDIDEAEFMIVKLSAITIEY